jgi:hypothetical protein
MSGYDSWIGPQWSPGLFVLSAVNTSASLLEDDRAETGYHFRARCNRRGLGSGNQRYTC